MTSLRNEITLSQLAALIRGAIERRFPDSVWVTAEIVRARCDQKGHCWIELIEKDNGTTKAQASAACWAHPWKALSRKFKEATGEDIKDGMKLLMLIKPTFHPVYGMKLIIEDVDPTYTLGALELQKRQTIERLRREGLLEKQKKEALVPEVLQRIAVITSPNAAGWGDFQHQIENNEEGYAFRLGLFVAVMQGEATEESVIKALDSADTEALEGKWDCAIILRGGGGTSELAVFDSYGIAARISCMRSKLPVLVSIGHQRDSTVAGLTAYADLITPTAAAEYILSGARAVDEKIGMLERNIESKALERLARENDRMAVMSGKFGAVAVRAITEKGKGMEAMLARLAAGATLFTTNKANKTEVATTKLNTTAQIFMSGTIKDLEKREQAVRLLDPATILRRGFSITVCNGRAIKSASEVTAGAKIRTLLASGEIESAVTATREV